MSVEGGGLNNNFIEKYATKQGATVFDKSIEGRVGAVFPDSEVPQAPRPPQEFLRENVLLPQLSEPEVVRHYTHLSKQNFSIGEGMYPLGSCTMKYNPRRHEEVVALSGFAEAHPDQPAETIQGTLEVLFGLQKFIASITGMNAVTLAPMGGAEGEFTGVSIIRAFHKKNRQDKQRRIMLIPDSAHGTNPATAAMAGYKVVQVHSRSDGNIDMDDFRSKMNENVAGVMTTEPTTLGLFNSSIFEMAEITHKNGGLVYGDGANMNAFLGKVRPRDLGIDVMHINTHKALTTPHGGGGPGAGPVAVIEQLAEFLPTPVVGRDPATGLYRFETPKNTIGRVSGWAGNIGVLLRAYVYIRTMGEEGLRKVSENAVLNANYVAHELSSDYSIQFGKGRRNMHEVVINGAPIGHNLGLHPNIDVAKRLIDYGYHPPTMSFPLIAENALMVEPTETEGKESLDSFIAAMRAIAQESRETPEVLKTAPHFTPVGRLDEATAARKPILRWKPS